LIADVFNIWNIGINCHHEYRVWCIEDYPNTPPL
jgi:hypothetical protein